MAIVPAEIISSEYQFGFHDEIKYLEETKHGLSREVIEEISRIKDEPKWMLDFRLRAYAHFLKRPMPQWGGDLNQIDLDKIVYYRKPSTGEEKSWDDVPDKIKQTFEKLGIPEAERKFLSGVGAQYDCLAAGAKVFTSRGPINIEDVRVDDLVFSLDEDTGRIIPSPVKATMAKGRLPIFRVRVGTRTIRVTGNHPFLALMDRRKEGRQRRRYNKEWQYLSDLQVNDLVATVKNIPDTGVSAVITQPAELTRPDHRKSKVRLPLTSSSDLLWWFGLFIGDGNLTWKGNKTTGRKLRGVQFAIPAAQPDLRTELIRVTRELFGIETQYLTEFAVAFNSKLLAEFLHINGFTETARTKTIPDWVFGLPESEKLSFLGGYVDSDGGARVNGRGADLFLTSVSKELLDQTRLLAMMVGINPSNVVHVPNSASHSETAAEAYRLFLYGDFEKIDIRYPYKRRGFNKRKYFHRYTHSGNTTFTKHTTDQFGFARILSIEPDGEAETYDLTVDGPHNFVAEGLLVHNSEVVYHNVREELSSLGVVFMGTDQGLREYPELFKKYFGTVVPPEDNKFAALNSAAWSGGSFLYVPKGVEVPLPVQAYFRINGANTGQFERTLIIVEEGAKVHYLEGCSAPIYAIDALHAAVVEVIALPNSKVRYTTIQNWSNDVYNLVTKRAHAYAHSTVEWIDANTGCLTGETAIYTGDTIKPLATIKPGDQVWSLSSEMTLSLNTVQATRVNPPAPVYELTLANGRHVRGTANHPFLALHPHLPGRQSDWVGLSDLRPHDEIAVASDLSNGLKLNVMAANNLPGPVNFVPVEKIAYVGDLPTYDIEVSGSANFIANGIFAHNSKLTMKYPSIYLRGEGATAEVISVAVAGAGQHQDTGAKAIHLAPNTKSRIISKSISKNGGRTTYRGSLKVASGATGVVASVRCDALILDEGSRSDTYPYIDINEDDTTMTHEATVGKISQEQVFYLMSRGLNENEAMNLVVQGFLEVFTKELPMEYAIEFNRLVKLEMEGSLG